MKICEINGLIAQGVIVTLFFIVIHLLKENYKLMAKAFCFKMESERK